MNYIKLIKDYWFILVLAVVAVVFYLKGRKTEPENKDSNAEDILKKEGIRNATEMQRYKAYAAEIAQKLGTSYPWYHPRRWVENDEQVYELVKDLNLQTFKVVKKLYFETYAKGRDLSTDLANMLDDRYYKLLKVK